MDSGRESGQRAGTGDPTADDGGDTGGVAGASGRRAERPNIAHEILSGSAAASVIATPDLEVAEALQRVLQRGVFRIYTNHDVIGCELGGALKNVVAIASGLAQGLYVGDNTRAAVMTRGLAELTRLGVALGADPATFAGLAGMGDLIVTCMSPRSRNRHVGEQLGLGRPLQEILGEMTMVAEGVKQQWSCTNWRANWASPCPSARRSTASSPVRSKPRTRIGGCIGPATRPNPADPAGSTSSAGPSWGTGRPISDGARPSPGSWVTLAEGDRVTRT